MPGTPMVRPRRRDPQPLSILTRSACMADPYRRVSGKLIALVGAFAAHAERVTTPHDLGAAAARAIERRPLSLTDIQAPCKE